MNLYQKNIFLTIGFVVSIALSYMFSISKTVNAKIKFIALTNEMKSVSKLPQQVDFLKQQNTHYDSVLMKHKIATEQSFQYNLLQLINEYVNQHKLKIISFNEPHIFVEKEITLKTYSFSVSGNYSEILNLIHRLEQNGSYGKLISLNFNKIKNYQTKKSRLECHLLLQKIERNLNN